MKPEDFPSVEFGGKQLLAVPELQTAPDDDDVLEINHPRCLMCIKERVECTALIDAGQKQLGATCGELNVVFISPARLDEYLVEFVRRRVS